MSKYIKLFQKEFEKYAKVPHRKVPKTVAPSGSAPVAGPTKAPRGGTPHRGQRPAAVAPSGGVGINPQTAVKEMQQALIDLSKAVTSQIKTEQMAPEDMPAPGSGLYPATPGPTFGREQTEAASRTSVGDFVAKMMRGTGVPGVEFNPDITKTQMADKGPREAAHMNIIMDTMKRIGNPKTGEFVIDGLWGPRTHAALRNANAFAEAMLKLVEEFNLKKATAYSESNLERFKIPESETELKTPQEKLENAQVYTKHIKAIHKLYDQIKEGLLEKPAYQEYFEGRPFATFDQDTGPGKGPAAPTTVDPQSMQSLQTRYKDGFQVMNIQTGQIIPIFIQDLATPQALQNWIHKNQIDQEPINIINQVKSRLAGYPIKPMPQRYEDTMSQSDKGRVLKRNPALEETEPTAGPTQVSGKASV